MSSGNGQSLGFASVKTHMTHPASYTHRPAPSVSEHALKLARFAYVRAHGNNPQSLSHAEPDGTAVIQTVAKAIERALKDAQFTKLSFEQQEAAAAHLTSQCMSGLKVVQALQGAMMNPYTMATQLKNNALRPNERHNVFDHIITAHRPSTTITAVAMHQIDSLPLGNA